MPAALAKTAEELEGLLLKALSMDGPFLIEALLVADVIEPGPGIEPDRVTIH